MPHAYGSHVLVLGSRLFVAITLPQTLISVSTHRYMHYYMRPHTAYLGRVLQKFNCHVTLLSPVTANQSAVYHRKFCSEFQCPHDMINGIAVPNYGQVNEHFQNLPAKHGGRRDRFLLIDSDVSDIFLPSQTIVVEKYASTNQRTRRDNQTAKEAREEKRIVRLQEDFTLVAVAEMIKELATSDVSVSEYLKVEPLVEKVRVPMYGTANVLPLDNCDHIEQIDLSQLEVSTPAQNGA